MERRKKIRSAFVAHFQKLNTGTGHQESQYPGGIPVRRRQKPPWILRDRLSASITPTQANYWIWKCHLSVKQRRRSICRLGSFLLHELDICESRLKRQKATSCNGTCLFCVRVGAAMLGTNGWQSQRVWGYIIIASIERAKRTLKWKWKRLGQIHCYGWGLQRETWDEVNKRIYDDSEVIMTDLRITSWW